MDPIVDTARSHKGVPAVDLGDDDLVRELGQLHRTRFETLQHGSDSALATHATRTDELEAEYRRRWPARDVDPARTREGRRSDEAPAQQEESR